MTLSTLITINGETLDDLGISTVSSPELDYVGVQRDVLGITGRLGGVAAAAGVGSPKRITLQFVLGATTIETRQATLDALFPKLQGLLEIEFGFSPDRVYWGYADLAPMRARYDSLAYLSGDVTLTLPIIVPSATAVAKNGTVLHIGTGVTEIVGLGTLPSAPLIIVPGPVTDLVVDYQDQSEITIQKLTITGSVGSGEYLEIDCATQRLIIGTEATGARVLTMSFFDHTVTDNGFPIFDPGDGVDGNPPLIQADVACVAYYAARYP